MTVINMTPHEVRVLRENHEDVVFPPSGDVARLVAIELGTQRYPTVPTIVELVEFHRLQDPPPMLEETWYIVSLPCALASPRDDFLVPYGEIRDERGRIIGCRMLARCV